MTPSTVHPDRYERIAPLLDDMSHSAPIVRSVIDGYSPGFVLADNEEQPSVAFIAPKGGFAYVAGEMDDALAHSLAEWLWSEWIPQLDAPELVLFTLTDAVRPTLGRALAEHGAITIQRRGFSFEPERFRPELGKAVPAGLTLKPMDAALAEQAGVVHTWRSAEDFLRHGVGFSLTDGDAVLSSCHTIFRGGNAAELEVSTDEKHQGKGYATVTAGATISRIISAGLTPAWSCWPFRQASQALAGKLGFVPTADIPAFFWEPGLSK